jgi:hypothetical protein
MKFWYFLQWKWKNSKNWEKLWTLGVFLSFAGAINIRNSWGIYLSMAAMSIFVYLIFRFWCHVQLESFRRFQEEQDAMISILKKTDDFSNTTGPR